MSDFTARTVDRAALGLEADAQFRDLLDGFLGWQARVWPRLARARVGLAAVQTRYLAHDGWCCQVQWNPGRQGNTTARVDAASVAARPCFLCAGALPPEERALDLGELVVLCNPAPILPGHLVLAQREHRPQAVRPALGPMLAFAEAAGGAYTAVYNGPRSGASAPDHLHLQAVQARLLPEEVVAVGRRGRWAAFPGRAVVGFAGSRAWVAEELAAAVELLAGLQGRPEPDLNLLATGVPGGVLALLFPRGAHRPACFHGPESESLLVSPGAVDMAGVVVTVREADFRRLDGARLAAIFAETSLGAEPWAEFRRLLDLRWSHD